MVCNETVHVYENKENHQACKCGSKRWIDPFKASNDPIKLSTVPQDLPKPYTPRDRELVNRSALEFRKQFKLIQGGKN